MMAGEGAAALPAVGMVRISLLAGVVAPPRLWRVAGLAPWAVEDRKKRRGARQTRRWPGPRLDEMEGQGAGGRAWGRGQGAGGTRGRGQGGAN